MESEGPRRNRGRDQKPPDGNVIPLPRDWVGPPEEPVPVVGSPGGPSDEGAARARPENDESGGETLGAISAWLGPDALLVPVAGTSGAAQAPITGDDFWGEDAAAVHSAVARPVAGAANARVRGDAASRVVSGIARRWRGMPRAAAWLPLALVVIAVGLVLRGALSAAPVRHPMARLTLPRIAAPSAGTSLRARPPAPAQHRRPQRPVPKPPPARSVAAAPHTRATPSAVASAPPTPATTWPSAASAPAAQPTYSRTAAGGDSNRPAASTSSSQAAGPRGRGALTGAGTTPSG